MTIFTVFFQMLALLIMIGAGYFVARTGMYDEHTNNQMSNLIVNLFNPLLVISSAVNSVGLISLNTVGTVGVIALSMFFFFIVVGMVLSPLFDKDASQRKIFQMMFVFSNLGFIGIPVVTSILGAEYVVYVTEFLLAYTIVFYTYGITVMEGKFSPSSLKAMINPGTAACLIALAIIIFSIQIPDFMKTAISYLGNVTSPMALVGVGFTLAHSELKKIFGEVRLYLFAVVKLLALPLLMLPVLRLFVQDQNLIRICMVMFGMPIGNMPLMVANQKGIDGTTCSASIILTTVLCVITVPVLILAAG